MADYRDAIKSFRQKVTESARQVVAATVQEMGFRVIDRTPVLTGRLVQNWRLAQNSPNPTEDTGFGPVRGQARQRLQATLRRVNLLSRLYFTNPVPYGPSIEYGTANVRARAMVRLTVAEFPSIAAEAIRQVKARLK